jgi:23S rRNA pseudouridine2605 synthase
MKMKNRKQTQGAKKTSGKFGQAKTGGRNNKKSNSRFTEEKRGPFKKSRPAISSKNKAEQDGVKSRFGKPAEKSSRTNTIDKAKARLADKRTSPKNEKEKPFSRNRTNKQGDGRKSLFDGGRDKQVERRGSEKRSFTKKSTDKKFTYKKGYQKSYEKKRKETDVATESFDGEIRLNRYLSNAGVCSRREADELIAAGLVSVNGVTITELGSKVKPGDEVKFNNERLSTERKAYIIMNKPKDTITSLEDPDKRRIVTDLLIGHDLPRVYPIGRLDRNTTGVLILTNDGELSQRLMHPKYGIQKVYKATLNKNFKGEHLWELANGLELEDGFMKPDAVLMPDPAQKNEVIVELHSGKNRIVHRLFEALGYSLDKLDRVVYAGFNKKGMKRGEWRELNAREVSQLKKQVQL